MRASEFLEAVTPPAPEDEYEITYNDHGPATLQKWYQDQPEQWHAKDPIISDPSLLQYLGVSFIPDEVYRYSPYNPSSPYFGAIARNIYSNKISQVKDMIRSRKPKESIVAFIDSLIPQASKRVPWVAGLLQVLHGGPGTQQMAQK
jgi:hypothetical protein